MIVETGQLSRGAKIAGRTLFIAAAFCLFGGGISIFISISHFQEFLAQESTTTDQIKQHVGHITHSLGSALLFVYVGLGLMALGLGCYLFGRRTPPVLTSKET